MEKGFGFREIEHTADWALEVQAPDLATLFAFSAEGMFWLMETSLQPEPRMEKQIHLEGMDVEELLVAFLSELLFVSEMEGLGFDQFMVNVDHQTLDARVTGAPISQRKKEIKAVTYHNLRVTRVENGLAVTIVFDV